MPLSFIDRGMRPRCGNPVNAPKTTQPPHNKVGRTRAKAASVANTSPDDVEELKQELAQFLLTEITSTQGQQTFRKEVSAEVAAVIDRVLNERLAPALQNIERQADEQMNQLTARVDAALRRFEQTGSVPGASPETDQKITDLTA